MIPVLVAINTGLQVTSNAAGYSGTGSLTLIIGRAIEVLLGAVGLIFLILTIYAGITWMFARGNEEEAKKSLRTITNAALALLVITGAYALTNYVLGALTRVVQG